MIKDHVSRIKNAIANTYSYYNLADWIQANTKLEGKQFSYLGHEFQRDIVNEKARTVYVNKAAQTGLSEIFARYMLATATTIENWTALWTFPSTTDAERFTKARLDPIIASSPAIRRALSKDVDSVELKKFNANSFIYMRGTNSETGALSVPVDILCHDEFDRSNMDNIAAYVSRLQHKPHKLRRIFSTPTLRGRGIDMICETATRKRQFWKCSHCAHHFLPDYHQDIKIPGWNDDLDQITKHNITKIKWQQAVLLCPKCGKEPDSGIEHRFWVTENPQDNFDPIAFYVSPFCAPAFITPSYLVKVSTEYGKKSEFYNQSLGKVAEDDEEVLTEADLLAAVVPYTLTSSEIHYMGFDMGAHCHVVIGRMATDGTILIVHKEKVHYLNFHIRRAELVRQYRIGLSVHDMFPYTDLIAKTTDSDPNAYGATYTTRNSSETHQVKSKEENAQEGRLAIRSVAINRDVAFDELMYEYKQRRVRVTEDKEIGDFIQNHQDMKRVSTIDKMGGIRMKWEKSNHGNDHYHHATLYCFIAIKMRVMAAGWTTPGTVPLVSSFINRHALT